jgi:antitoxin PrlF
MNAIEEICTITAKGQTTVPKAIRQALGVSYGDQIIFRIDGEQVTVHPADPTDRDPALAPFLALLEHDIASRPAALVPLDPSLLDRMESGIEDIHVDPNDPIEGESVL